MISLDISVAYQIILFLILWAILHRVVFRPFLALLEKRELKTQGARQETAELEREGGRLKAQYEEKIAQAHAASNAAKEVIVRDARQQREQILNQARVEAASVLERARQEIQHEMQRARQLAAIEVAAVAQEMVSKVLGRRVG
jgi:F-type H+-transporting ATPase subunit b